MKKNSNAEVDTISVNMLDIENLGIVTATFYKQRFLAKRYCVEWIVLRALSGKREDKLLGIMVSIEN